MAGAAPGSAAHAAYAHAAGSLHLIDASVLSKAMQMLHSVTGLRHSIICKLLQRTLKAVLRTAHARKHVRQLSHVPARR